MKTLPQGQLDQLSKQLRERRAALLADIRRELQQSDDAKYIDLAGRVHDPAEESVAALLVDLDLAVIDLQIKELADIEAALARIREGSYGFCEVCDEPIAFARLSSTPTAVRCLGCQERFEKTTVQQGRPRL